MLPFLSIFKNPNTWKLIGILVVVTLIGGKMYSMSNTIDFLKEDNDKKERVISEVRGELEICKSTNISNQIEINGFKEAVKIQNEKIKESEIANIKLANVVDENKKNKPSTKIITITPKKEDCKYTRFKGIKYEDL